jgi:hypothetical protein
MVYTPSFIEVTQDIPLSNQLGAFRNACSCHVCNADGNDFEITQAQHEWTTLHKCTAAMFVLLMPGN